MEFFFLLQHNERLKWKFFEISPFPFISFLVSSSMTCWPDLFRFSSLGFRVAGSRPNLHRKVWIQVCQWGHLLLWQRDKSSMKSVSADVAKKCSFFTRENFCVAYLAIGWASMCNFLSSSNLPSSRSHFAEIIRCKKQPSKFIATFRLLYYAAPRWLVYLPEDLRRNASRGVKSGVKTYLHWKQVTPLSSLEWKHTSVYEIFDSSKRHIQFLTLTVRLFLSEMIL